MRVQFLGREGPPGEGNGSLLQYSCLGEPTDRGARQVTAGQSVRHDSANKQQTTTEVKT